MEGRRQRRLGSNERNSQGRKKKNGKKGKKGKKDFTLTGFLMEGVSLAVQQPLVPSSC